MLEGAAAAGVRLVTVPQALEDHEPERRPLRRASWGEDKDFSTWDSPPVADLAWGARRLELRAVRAIRRLAAAGDGPREDGGTARAHDRAERAARELLAAQASDWAFLDRRGQAGDYAWQRAADHSEALYEAIGCDRVTDPRMRSLAPDMTLAPLLEP